MSRFPSNMTFRVGKAHIEEAKCGDPNKCAIKLAVKEQIGGHGYVKVDTTGIAITRRPDYREKAFLPKRVARWILNFDRDKNSVGPITFGVKFMKTTPIVKAKDEWLQTAYEWRKKRAAKGIKHKSGNTHSKRIAGLALTDV